MKISKAEFVRHGFLSDTEVLRQSRVPLGWVLSDNFRVGRLFLEQNGTQEMYIAVSKTTIYTVVTYVFINVGIYFTAKPNTL